VEREVVLFLELLGRTPIGEGLVEEERRLLVVLEPLGEHLYMVEEAVEQEEVGRLPRPLLSLPLEVLQQKGWR
jgi:hypothetical protein